LNRGHTEQPKAEEPKEDAQEQKTVAATSADDDEEVEEEYFSALNESLLAREESWGWEIEIPTVCLSTFFLLEE